MEANMSIFKRRLNKAMLECRSQASWTARRLVVQIRTMEKRARIRNPKKLQHQHRNIVGSSTSSSASNKPKRHFSYSFANPDSLCCGQSSVSSQIHTTVPEQYYYCQTDEDESEQQQQVEEFLSDEESSCSQLPPSNSTAVIGRLSLRNQENTLANDSDNNRKQTLKLHSDSREGDENWSRLTTNDNNNKPKLTSVGSIEMKRKYPYKLCGVKNSTANIGKTIQASLKTSLTQPSTSSPSQVSQHFVRYSALGGSKRRSSARRLRRSNRSSGQNQRQVRFQPIPQSIDISNQEGDDEIKDDNDDDDDDINNNEEADDNNNVSQDNNDDASTNKPHTSTSKNYQRATKPQLLSKKLHLTHHLKFNKSRLKGFAQQLQQSLASSSSSTSARDFSLRHQRSGQGNFRLSKGGIAARFVPTSEQEHVMNQHHTSVSNELQENEDDFGWGSDFDEQSSQESSLTNQGADGGYLLEIGKSSADFRAVEDVIQDQGICGQFKRLEMDEKPSYQSENQVCVSHSTNNSDQQRQQQQQLPVVNYDEPKLERELNDCSEASEPEKQVAAKHVVIHQQQQQPLHAGDDELGEENSQDEEDEEELRSLEARQGFRQIRDKLKLILDQRLADYERSARDTGATCDQGEQLKICGTDKSVTASFEATPVLDGVRSSSLTASKITQHTQHTQQQQVTGDLIYEDCQSHCSDESGLESNHSGSQDSGHSTQHSGYSAHSRCAAIGHHVPSSVRPLDSPRDELATPTSDKVSHPQAVTEEEEEGGEEERELRHERRSRFLQNRLIINSKLESMFQKGPSLPSSPNEKKQIVNRPMSEQLVVADRDNSQHHLQHHHHHPHHHHPQLAKLDPETRMKLLEQQRQMSLKLKQKPRRKTAKQVHNQEQPNQTSNTRNFSNNNNVDSNTEEDNGSYVSNSSSGELQRVGSKRRATRNSLTKQLSMICLRQQQVAAISVHQNQAIQVSAGSSDNLMMHKQLSLGSPVSQQQQQQQQQTRLNSPLGRPAMSLRQLVKDVIDDYEKPNSGRLDQSDSSSSSSDLAISADDLANTNSSSNVRQPVKQPQQQLHPQPVPISIGQLKSQCSLAGSSKDSLSSLQSSTCSPTSCAPQFYQPIQFVAPSQYHYQQAVADQSMSSMGSTIEGLEYSRVSGISSLADLDGQTNAELTSKPVNTTAAPNCKSSHNSNSKSSIVSYLKSLREISRFKLPKVRIATNGASQQPLQHQQLENNRQIQASFDKSHNYVCDYRLDAIGNRVHEKQPEGNINNNNNNNTLSGATWRRRAHRTSIIMDSPIQSTTSTSSVISSKGSDTFANHFVTISNRKWKSCHLRTSLMQIAFNSSTQHQQSPTIGNGKQHLAYLDNSRNFTDDDTY